MQVKVFESTDMTSGLQKVRKELGPDALILSTRTIKNGKLGLLGKQIFEITAAIDSAKPPIEDIEQKANIPSSRVHNAYRENSLMADAERLKKTRKHDNFQKTEEYLHSDEDAEIRREFDDLKNMVKNLAGEISLINSNAVASQEIPAPRVINRLEQKLNLSRHNDHIENILITQGVNSDTAKTISSFAHDSLSDSDLHNNERLYSFLNSTIADIISVKPPCFEGNSHQKRIALLGPTGVGKTTTLAKIAASYLSEISNSIALITIDTYRIAAVEQLKVYGEIMHLPVDVVITPQQLENAINKHQDKSLILIDTAGRSPRDNLCIDELKTFLHADLQIENHLVMSATTREIELLETLNQFNRLGIDSTIFTKIDECINLGVLLNILVQSNSPVSYLTNGQRVPEDIVKAEKQFVAQLVVPPPNGIFNGK